MKYRFNFLIILCVCEVLGCSSRMSQTKNQLQREFLYKTEYDTSKENYGMHIEIKQVLPDTKELIPMSIDDRDAISRSKYTRNDEIKILGEYLTFRGDTTTSNKKYRFRAGYYMTYPEGVNGFTVQIEALYSFTRMLTQGLPPIKPALISRVTGEQLNLNKKVLNEVYDIYEKWYKNNKKSDFKTLSMPLAGSPYCWLGEDKGIETFLKKSL